MDRATVRPGSIGPLRVVDVVGVLVSCLVVVAAFWPILFDGRTLSTAAQTAGTNGWAPFPGQPELDHSTDFRPDKGASSWALEPWAEVTHRLYTDGEVPLWNPFQAAGSPHAANMQSAVFDPLLITVNLHPTPLTWDLSIIGAFFLGAAAAFVFGRILGLGVIASVVTSAAFSMSGWFFLYSNNGFCRSYVYLPLLFLLVELVLRTRKLLPILGLAIAVAGNVYVGMPEASLVVLGSAAAYAAVRLVQERRRAPIHLGLIRLGSAGALGLTLSAPLVLLLLEYEPLSFNIHKSGDARGSETDEQWGLLNWLVPFFSEPPSSGPAPSVRSWFGVAVGISALAAMSGRTETRRLHTWLFLGLGGFALLKIYEFRVLDWFGRLPLVETVVFPRYAPMVASFAFAVLAGIGVQVVSNHDLRLRRFLTLLAAAAVLLGIFVSTGDRWPRIVGAPRDWAASAWGTAALSAGIAVAAVLVGSRLNRRWGSLLLAAVVGAELFMLAPSSMYTKRADPYVAPGWMSLVREALGSEPHSRVYALDGKLYPNTAGAHGLQDVRVLDALYVDRYWRYVRTFIQPVYDRFTGTELPAARIRGNPMFDALGVRAIVSQRALAEAPELTLLGRVDDTRVYEKTDAFPRAWVVRDIHLLDDEDDAFSFLQERARRTGEVFVVDRFDPRREAVVENRHTADRDLRAVIAQEGTCDSRRGDVVDIEKYSGQTVILRATTSCPGLLVLPDTYYPGWKATVNGQKSRIYPTNGAFRGVVVAAGTSRVELRYEPRTFSAGIVIAILGLVAFALAVVLRRMRSEAPSGARDDPPPRTATPAGEDASGGSHTPTGGSTP